LPKEKKQAFEIRVQRAAGKSAGSESAGDLCESGRRFAGFRHRREDQNHGTLCLMKDAEARVFGDEFLFTGIVKSQIYNRLTFRGFNNTIPFIARPPAAAKI
jgi:hypothetical protein